MLWGCLNSVPLRKTKRRSFRKKIFFLTNVAEAQLLNYLSISGLSVGYLFNCRNTSLSWKGMVKDAYASRDRSERPGRG